MNNPHILFSGYESGVNKNNAARQLGVNERANWVGAGTGTARRDGVPGTPLGVTGHDRYSYGHGGHGGYGHGGHGGYGYGGHGGYGHGGFGHGGFSHGGYGNGGYGHGGYGHGGYGHGGYGHGGYGYGGH